VRLQKLHILAIRNLLHGNLLQSGNTKPILPASAGLGVSSAAPL